jgi:hypothetical protein
MGFSTKAIADKGVAKRIKVEGRIARSLVNELLAQGFTLSVYDGEDYAIQNSNSASAVIAAMASTDFDHVIGRNAETAVSCLAVFIYGNDGWDVIADSSSNLDELTPKTQSLIDKLSE